MQRKNQADSHARPSSFALGLLWRDEPASPKIKIGCLDQQDKQDGNPSVYSVYSVVKKPSKDHGKHGIHRKQKQHQALGQVFDKETGRRRLQVVRIKMNL